MVEQKLDKIQAIAFVHKLRTDYRLPKISDIEAVKKYNLTDCNSNADLIDFVGDDQLEQDEWDREAADWERETMQ